MTTPTTGVAMTALGVAVIRARENEQPDALYKDPYAQLFVDAAHQQVSGTDEGRGWWDRLQQAADMFYPDRTLGVRVGDDRMLRGVESGLRQIVLLGAGLDTRAYRMPLPTDTRFFEVDLPELFAFKEPVLEGIEPVCFRRPVITDLREDWSAELQHQGFDPAQPTLWCEEGALPYLPSEDAWRVVERLTELSAPGSRYGISRFPIDPTAPRYRALAQLTHGTDTPATGFKGLGDDAEERLNQLGWTTEFEPWTGLLADIGRPNPDVDAGWGFVRAIRS
ncbi:SAM-dependent methyltransferase [Pseudonocardiaceae bacterium YIM PH 21723]|nr:SAM-dependent methyltransferase [Pseudonocardiaceae bacterium YIM PH 21723]